MRTTRPSRRRKKRRKAVTTERTPTNPPSEPRKELVDRERQKDADRDDVRDRGPDTGGGKLRPSDR